MGYLPAESDSGMFGGNSNWRGPIWMPVNGLIIRALLQYYSYYGNDFTVECPTGSGRQMTLYQVAQELSRRLTSIFLRNNEGRRPVYGDARKFQEDPHWRDLILFYEYFHGDNGAGLGASHQTGWTGSSRERCICLAQSGRAVAGDGQARVLSTGRRRPDRSTSRQDSVNEPRYPALFQINTRVWLTELSRGLGRPATLDDIPDAEWERFAHSASTGSGC